MGKIYTFYSPQRGAGLSTLLVKIGEWLAGHTELTVAVLDFTNRPENACVLTGNEINLDNFLSKDEVSFKKDLLAAICNLKPNQEASFTALQKAGETFDIVFVDLSNRLDRIAHQVLDLSDQMILLAPGTEAVVRYFQNMMEMSNLLGKNKAKQVNLLINRIRREADIAILDDEIKNQMIGFVMDELNEESIQRVAENFYYDYYLQLLADQRVNHLQTVIEKFAKNIEDAKDEKQLSYQLWKSTADLELAYNKRILLIRWLVFRATIGQPFAQAAAELVPRFISEHFNDLARDMSIEAGALGGEKINNEDQIRLA